MRSFPTGSDGKESAHNAGDLGSILGSGRSPGEGNGHPLPVFVPRESHGQKSHGRLYPWTVHGVTMSQTTG